GGGGDAVAVAQQGDQQVAEDDGVHRAVGVLEQHRRDRPVIAAGRTGLGAVLVPDVPLVEADHDALVALELGAHMVGGRDDGVDEVVHVVGRGEEGGLVAVLLRVVGVGRDHVDQVVGLGEDGVLPGREGLHLRAGGAAGDQLEGGVLLAHEAGGLGGDPRVLLGGLVPGLPGAVHLVAEAPHADAVGLGVAVLGALVGVGDAL